MEPETLMPPLASIPGKQNPEPDAETNSGDPTHITPALPLHSAPPSKEPDPSMPTSILIAAKQNPEPAVKTTSREPPHIAPAPVVRFAPSSKEPDPSMPPPALIPSKQNPEPDAETNSLVQPGRRVLGYQLPPELRGTLEITSDSLGEGSFATVFKGILTSPEGEKRTVAIKRVKLPGAEIGHDQFRTRIKRETVIWTTAAHPNILPFIGYQIVKNSPMLVSPWCEKGNLSSYIFQHPELTRNDKIKLLCDAARGLLHLHNLDPQIVHGDIKPENVIVQDNLVAALCDFGISKIHVEQHTGLTTSGKTGGTSGYQAKELLEEDSATPATDVYAFGGLILAAMSGKQPFWNKKPSATIIAVFNDRTPARKDHPLLPPDDPLWDLLTECWKGEPEDRPPMDKVLAVLEAQG